MPSCTPATSSAGSTMGGDEFVGLRVGITPLPIADRVWTHGFESLPLSVWGLPSSKGTEWACKALTGVHGVGRGVQSLQVQRWFIVS